MVIRQRFLCCCHYWNTVDGRNPAPVEVGSLSHYLQVLVHPRWCRISSINSMACFSFQQLTFRRFEEPMGIHRCYDGYLAGSNIIEHNRTLKSHNTPNIMRNMKLNSIFHITHICTVVIFSRNHVAAGYLHVSEYFLSYCNHSTRWKYLFGPISTKKSYKPPIASNRSLRNGHTALRQNHPRLWLLIPLPLCEKRFWRLWLVQAFGTLS